MLYGVVGEGQRTYAAYGKEGRLLAGRCAVAGRVWADERLAEYGFPMDDRELDRMDLCHSMYYALLDKRRFLAPATKNPQRILDIGCGTGNPRPDGGLSVSSVPLLMRGAGIWAVDMADEYPSAEVESQSSTCCRRERACR